MNVSGSNNKNPLRPKGYQVLVIQSKSEGLKALLRMKTFMTLSYLHLWLGNLHPDTRASHGIHYFKKLKGFSLSSLGISSPKDVWLLRK